MRVRRSLPWLVAFALVLLLLFLFAPPFGSIRLPVPANVVVEGCSLDEAEMAYGETTHQIAGVWRRHFRNLEFHSAWASFHRRRYSNVQRIAKMTNGWIATEIVYKVPGQPTFTNVVKTMYMRR